MRSLSLTRSSAAPRHRDAAAEGGRAPRAPAARRSPRALRRARSRGRACAPCRTRSRPTGSPCHSSVDGRSSTSAPTRRSTSSSAVRVGFRPTSSMSTSRAGQRRRGDRQNAADEMSPGRAARGPSSRWPPVDADRAARRRRPRRRTRPAPAPYDRGSRPARRPRSSPLGLQAGQQHRALDLGARHLGREVNAGEVGRPWMRSGGRSPSARRCVAPISRERRDDAAHRPARERRVADQRRCEGMRGERRRPASASWCRSCRSRAAPAAARRPRRPRPSIVTSGGSRSRRRAFVRR